MAIKDAQKITESLIQAGQLKTWLEVSEALVGLCYCIAKSEGYPEESVRRYKASLTYFSEIAQQERRSDKSQSFAERETENVHLLEHS